MPQKKKKIKVFVASTVYNFQPQLDQVYDLLTNYGYEVIMSHKGTLPVNSNRSNLDNCIEAVKECDVFVGFIRPSYGSGVIDNISITHHEFKTALQLDMPKFVLVDSKVVFARIFLNKMQIECNGKPVKVDLDKVTLMKGSVVDVGSIKIYNEAVKDGIDPVMRIGNWVQEYMSDNDFKLHLDSQFKYPERISRLIEERKSKS